MAASFFDQLYSRAIEHVPSEDVVIFVERNRATGVAEVQSRVVAALARVHPVRRQRSRARPRAAEGVVGGAARLGPVYVGRCMGTAS